MSQTPPDDLTSFDLAAPAANSAPKKRAPRQKAVDSATSAGSQGAIAGDAQILSYRHPDRRANNPEVGMVTPATDPDAGKTRWAHDPHLDPELRFDAARAGIENLIDEALQSDDSATLRSALEELKRLQSPYLNWAGKAEGTSFAVDTVSLHVHERIDPASILSALRRKVDAGRTAKTAKAAQQKAMQPGLFDAPFENLPLRDGTISCNRTVGVRPSLAPRHHEHKKVGLSLMEGIASVLASRLRYTNAELRALES